MHIFNGGESVKCECCKDYMGDFGKLVFFVTFVLSLLISIRFYL
ncbi:hypothetical protein HMPREF1321_0621 [Capnocytophaga sp. oral taxon 412 str. F0487]|nr:hypothetical protein HMPREF1321_0621 [Capnocytophaga sp. oral taxon 412 str. F0487]